MNEIHEEYWWTNSWRKNEVLPLGVRLLLAPAYAIYTMYLCVRGRVITVRMKETK